MHSSTMQCWRGGSAEAAPGRAQLNRGDSGFAAGGAGRHVQGAGKQLGPMAGCF